MAQSNGVSATDPLKAWRDARNAVLSSWSRVALQVASSDTYSLVSSAVARPGLMATALIRKESERWMAQLLGQLNLPTRTEVLALSTRLTHIETALDDLAAAVESLRTAAAPPRPAKRPRNGSGKEH